ncbi:MAG: hypothetical protein Q8M20_10510 [Rhodocyclaceae bacterium]|nr:hypothetical protein [Rhodocyclaceae bacterium]MDZ4213673.1 hypothetical protein [Rhodocyclaceae bacterium]
MEQPSFLAYRNYRYLKITGLVITAALIAYLLARPAGGAAYGGTIFGYALGIASALIVLVLTWYGIRKRRPPKVPERREADRRKFADTDATRCQSNRRVINAEESWRHGTTLQGWLSMHVYLGIALVVLTSLHAGFRVGWNIHTLAYVLVLLVCLSGLYGTYAYLRYPRLITENIGEESLDDLLLKISEADELATHRATDLPSEVKTLVSRACRDTRLGGKFIQQISGRQHDCPTKLAVERLRELGKELVDGDQPRLIRDLYTVLLQKQRLVDMVRKEISLNARMRFWLYLHAPLSIALLAALLAHILTILIYW